MPDQPVLDVAGPVLAEVFVVVRGAEGLRLTGPCGPEAWHIEVPAGEDPTEVVGTVVRRVLGPPVLVHSTSWRRAKGAVTLSFLVVVGPEQVGGMADRAVGHVELARGEATAAPTEVPADAVLEHALRHLAWLVKDDDAVAAALDEGWHDALRSYVPEPFRAIT